MATTIRDLLVRLGVEADTDKAESFDKAVGSAAKTIAAAAAAAAAFAAVLTGLAASTAATGDEVAKGAQKYGISTDAYQELAFAAEHAGTSISSLGSALKLQAGNAADAANGTGTAKDAFDSLGVSVTDANGELKSQEQLLYETAEALSQVDNETEKLALATDIYGRSATELMPLLNGGAEGLAAMAAEAHELGAVLDAETLQASEQFADSLQNAKAIVTGLKNQIGAALLPVINELLGRFQDWFVANKELITSRLEEWTAKLISGIEWLIGAVESVVDFMGGWENTLMAIAGAIGVVVGAFAAFQIGSTVVAIFGAISTAIGFIGTVGLPVIAAIAAAVVYLIGLWTTVALVVQDFMVFMDGGQSVIGDLWAKMQSGEGILGSIGSLLNGIVSVVQALIPIMEMLFDVWWAVFSHTTLPLLKALGGLLLWIGSLFVDVIGVALQGLAGWLNMVALGLETLASWLTQLMSAATAGMDAIGGLLGSVGIDVGFGGGGEASAAVAPSSTDALGGGSGTTNNVQTGGNTYNMTSTMTAEEVQELIRQEREEENRQAAAAVSSQEY